MPTLPGPSDSVPDPAIAHAMSGLALLRSGNAAAARDAFNQALALNPRMPLVYNNRGTARQALHDLRGAVADFDAALELEPRLHEAYFNRAAVRVALHDRAGALADYTAGLALAPHFAEGYLGRGRLRREGGDFGGALADLDEAIRRNPGLTEAYLHRATLHHVSRNWLLAVADYDQAIAHYGSEPSARRRLAHLYTSRGNAHYHCGNNDRAFEDYQTAYTLDVDAYAAASLSAIQVGMREDLNALFEDCSRHLAKNPNDAIAYAYRGLVLLKLGRKAEAWADLEQRFRLGRYPMVMKVVIDRLGDAEDQARAEEWVRRVGP
jgi:tetratricopeptide (TPR) repeat protein